MENNSIEKLVKDLVFHQNNKRYILKCDLEKLDDYEKECVFAYIANRKIKIVDYEITRKDRPRTVDEYDYGYIDCYGISHLDMPVFAKLEYNDNGDLIYEDYSDLDDFIEKYLISNYIYKDTKNNTYYIKFSTLLSFKLCEVEIEYIVKYLKKKDIYVNGNLNTFNDEPANCSNRRGIKHVPASNSVDVDKIDSKLALYQNNPSIELRNELIELNINLVKIVAWDVKESFKFINLSYEELESYGYLGLINAIEKYKINYSYKFSSYAYKAIKRTIIREVGKSLGIDANVYNAFCNATMFVQNKLKDDNYCDISVKFDEIVEYMLKYKVINGYSRDSLKEMLMLLYCESLDLVMEQGFECEPLEQDNLLPLCILKEEVYSILKSKMDLLNERERLSLIKYYDLDNNGSLLLKEIGEIYGVSREAIRQNIEKTLLKFRNSRDVRNLHDSIIEYDQYNYNPNLIVAHQNRKYNKQKR